MASSASKKVRVLRFEREPLHGFVQTSTFQTPLGIEFLSQNGNLSTIGYEEVRAICFVQGFDDPPPRLDGAYFVSRPKKSGLWVRMRFRDGVQMDGLLGNQLLQSDPFGFMITPPDQAINPQWIFVPRAALVDFQVLAVVGSGLKASKKLGSPKPEAQAKLF